MAQYGKEAGGARSLMEGPSSILFFLSGGGAGEDDGDRLREHEEPEESVLELEENVQEDLTHSLLRTSSMDFSSSSQEFLALFLSSPFSEKFPFPFKTNKNLLLKNK